MSTDTQNFTALTEENLDLFNSVDELDSFEQRNELSF